MMAFPLPNQRPTGDGLCPDCIAISIQHPRSVTWEYICIYIPPLTKKVMGGAYNIASWLYPWFKLLTSAFLYTFHWCHGKITWTNFFDHLQVTFPQQLLLLSRRRLRHSWCWGHLARDSKTSYPSKIPSKIPGISRCIPIRSPQKKLGQDRIKALKKTAMIFILSGFSLWMWMITILLFFLRWKSRGSGLKFDLGDLCRAQIATIWPSKWLFKKKPPKQALIKRFS